MLIFLLPIGYWLVVLIRGQRAKQDKAWAERLKQHEEEYEKMKEAHRIRAQAEYERAIRNRIPTPSVAQQQAAMARMQWDRDRAAQRQSVYNGYGFLDPRSTYAAQQSAAQQSQNNMVNDLSNAALLYNLMNSGPSNQFSHHEGREANQRVEDTPRYESPAPSSYSSDTSSSSSSSSSDTSSDSFGGSDTSSDSF
jgi:hypothetical protein